MSKVGRDVISALKQAIRHTECQDAKAIEVINTEKEYAQALQRMRNLWNARKGTPEHAQLEILGALIAAYEDKQISIERRPEFIDK